jgi:crotonobetainyl-CoA:carnitine CoA-transferase CaiB-like acyl-CoA transferase
MGSFIAGPFCGQLLADLGAEVIKIEPPGEGDAMRRWGAEKKEGASLWWPVIGRNKRSLTLDLRQPAGQAIARRLILSSDVLVENFRPGTLSGWGLDPDELRAAEPRLIVAQVSGFGQTGPYRDRAGFGSVAEAMGGLRALTGFADRPPTRVGISVGDSLAGLFTALGVLGALYARDGGLTPGQGQAVDVGITDAIIALQESVLSEFSATGALRQRTGSVLPGIAPSNLYPTRDDSWVIIGGNADGVFRRLCTVMERPDLASDPRYATHQARGAHQQALDDLIASWTVQWDRDDLLARLIGQGVPAGPVNTAEDVINDPHFRARASVVEVDGGPLGPLTMQGVVPRLSGTPGRVRWTGPELGSDTTAILKDELGLSDEAIGVLASEGVI